jgi:outer membrane immunogenic protein
VLEDIMSKHTGLALAAGFVLLGLGATGIASAADMPLKAMPAPIPVPVYNWTGFYVGLNGGGTWLSDHLTSIPADAGTTAFWGPCFAAGACPRDYGRGSNSGSGEFGGQAGYNWQVSNWVIGIETDIQWTDARSNAAIALANTGTGFVPFNGAATSQLRWFGTTRGRVGVLVAPTWLLYGTGGVAYGSIRRTWTANFPATAQLVTGIDTQDEVGWTVGAGAEWLFAPNWSVGAEYLFARFSGSNSFAATGFGSAGCTALNCNFIVNSQDRDINIARVKVNYHFGGPVVAKY